VLPAGVSVVGLTVSDGKRGSDSATVTITVNPAANTDTTPPVLSLPGNRVLEATGPAGAVATFSATATDAVDGSRPVTCMPASGATFALERRP